jgi:prolyl oligopeptidase
MPPSHFPAAPRTDLVERLHGVDVADPYRPLEGIDAPETMRWVEAQAARSQAFLHALPGRDATEAFMLRASSYYKRGLPQRHGERTFLVEDDGKRPQAVLSVLDEPDAVPRVLIDPNLLSRDGTIALSGWYPSHDGRHVAYGLSEAGSDAQILRIRDVETGADLPEAIDRCYHMTVAWAADNGSFLYTRAPQAHEVPGAQPRRYGRVLRHKLGSSPDVDELVIDIGKPSEIAYPFTYRRGEWEVLWLLAGTEPKNGLAVRPARPGQPFITVLDRGIGAIGMCGLVSDSGNDTLYAHTRIGAPKGRVVAIDLAAPSPHGSWRTLIPEGEHSISDATLAGDRIAVALNTGTGTQIDLHALDGTWQATLPIEGPVSAGFDSNDMAEPELRIGAVGYRNPSVHYRYDVASGELARTWKAEPVADLSDAVVEVLQATSRDGTRVPMVLVRPPDIAPDGTHGALMYGYGGFGASQGPTFSTQALQWVRNGGVYVMTHLRGGREFGQGWHDAGRLAHKQNTFDDFIACAEALVAAGWTRPDRIAIMGASNGGLLVTACMLQRPDLFGAVVAQVAVTDLLRFHKAPVGAYWVSDYGDPENADDFARLLRLSPLHNVAAGTKYPPILLTTGDHDDRVPPYHTYKLAAALQETTHPDNRVLLRVDLRAGHGAGKSREKAYAELADIDAFLAHALGLPRPGA